VFLGCFDASGLFHVSGFRWGGLVQLKGWIVDGGNWSRFSVVIGANFSGDGS
jgi:hypothetical protein